MALDYKEFPTEGIVEIRVDGKVTREEYHHAVNQLESFIFDHGTVRLVEIVEDFEGFDSKMFWDGLKFDMKYIPSITHCAVVSDIGWIAPLSKAAGALLSTKLRTFGMAELEDARAWVRTPE
ncbi:STAS/SEC14 domain-containing protein [Pseudoruegeria sp. SHC-113]|uniref:STAS/SEC14 domain-containing protein n=1 Tax=Pseudoruegeria sp. SHC-113 TaxID=2855439 RepID=UPI0021BB807C|nr:STAS/SEC14 domain-containing protein [Pseudoruegeria sp. SHC-113]MCT8158484.1 STAS/SEC14 domain-containing protein [Pseudoruegeria sp. SHC-113]